MSAVFIVASALRRFLFFLGWLRTVRLPIPVVIVGNITLGGTGKTPLVLYLALRLQEQGWRPAIVSRGYRGAGHGPVLRDADPHAVGDEPVLLAKRSGVPVYVGQDRAEAASTLLKAHPHTNVLLCDDGLQHYRLGRDIELCVIDGIRGVGNGWRLPTGPLRESRKRVRCVDAVIMNAGKQCFAQGVPYFYMTLYPSHFYLLNQPETRCTADHLTEATLTAVCGIAHPQRFFITLKVLGLRFQTKVFPDHYCFKLKDLPTTTVVVTEKDAVKLAILPGLSTHSPKIWVLSVQAALTPDLGAWLHKRLKTWTLN